MRRIAAAPIATLAVIAACSARHPTGAPLDGDLDAARDAGAGDASSDDGPPGLDLNKKPSPDGACGYQALDARREPANLYFVLDRSGSMSEVVGGMQKLHAARVAAVQLVEKIGFRARIGASVFPGASGEGCAPGQAVFPTKGTVGVVDGDPKSFADMGVEGPVATQFDLATTVLPDGGTPTAATLAALRDPLASLGKNTFVVLVTDGGPNCDEAITCPATDCTPNIDGIQGCTPQTNCCDPSVDPHFTWGNCLDRDATLTAVSSLAEVGVKVIVVGIPGSEAYASLLDAMAVAGGAPRDADPRYYAVDAEHLGELGDVLAKIGSQVIISCDIALSGPPPEKDYVNLWFDDTLIPEDPNDGWTYTSDTTIQVHGSACDDLLSGGVDKVEVFLGCPTTQPK